MRSSSTRRSRGGRFSRLLALFLLTGATLVLSPAAYALNYFSTGTGIWATLATWRTGVGASCAGGGTTPALAVPTTADPVTVCPGHTVTINSAANALSLTVGDGVGAASVLTFGTTGSRILTAAGDVTVTSTGSITVQNDAGNNRSHTFNVAGNLSNAGTLDLQANVGGSDDEARLVFNKNGNQTLSGGGFFDIALMTLNMGTSNANELDVTATTFAAASPFLTITNGTFKLNANVTLTPWNANTTIPASGGFWVADGTVNFNNTTFTITGRLKMTGGTFNVGNGIDERLLGNAGGSIIIEGGALNISGRFNRNAAGNAYTFNMSGGTMTVGTSGGNDNGFSSFHMEAAATFIMSGGTIVIQRPGDNNGVNNLGYQNLAAGVGTAVTGGTIQIGNSSTAVTQTFNINATVPFWNLVVNDTNNPTAALVTNNITVRNSLTIGINGGGGNGTLSAGTQSITLGSTTPSGIGNWTNHGVFTAGSGTVTFTGDSSATTLDGTVTTTFNNLTMNKSAGALTINTDTLAHSPVVTGALTFTDGKIDAATNARRVIVGTAGSVAGTLDSTQYVYGCVRKNFTSAAGQSFTFPIGDSTNYTPVAYTMAGTTANSVAGDVTACTTAAYHPNITHVTSSINSAQVLKRYWTLTANDGGTGTPNGTYEAVFTFVGGDNLLSVNTSTVIVERYSSPNWFPTTIGTRNALDTKATDINGYGDFAIGNPLAGVTSTPGAFNAFEQATPAAAVLGKINTKIAGKTLNLGVAVLNTTKDAVSTTTSTSAKIWLVDASSSATPNNANGCHSSWTFLGTTLPALANLLPAPGPRPTHLATASFTAPTGRVDISVTTNLRPWVDSAPSYVLDAPNAFKDVRVLMQDSSSDAVIGCSTDRFTIRPDNLALEAWDGGTWQTDGTSRNLHNSGTSGGAVHAASTTGTPFPFTFTATAKEGGTSCSGSACTTTLYDGTPTLKSGSPACVEPVAGCDTGTLTVGSWTTASGVLTAHPTYTEAGTLNVEFEDQTYAAVDTTDGSTSQYYASDDNPGWTVTQSPAPRLVGRFVPTKLALSSLVTPVFKTYDNVCVGTRSFTYVGQPFKYGTTPQVTITAQNAGGGTTKNYSGGLWKIGSGSPTTAKDCTTDPNSCVFTNDWSSGGNVSKLTETYSYALTPVSTPNWDNSQTAAAAAAVSAGTLANRGTGTLSFSASPTLAFLRNTTTPLLPFTASITDTLSAQDTSESGITISTSPSFAFSAITFDAGNAFRYGRLRLFNAVGSAAINLPVALTAEYYSSTGFATNTADNCTTVDAGHFEFRNFSGSPTTLTATELPDTNVTVGASVLAAGAGTVTVVKPTSATVFGSADICMDLGTADAACTGSTVPSTDRNWLLGPYGAATYTKDPTARISFGVYGAQPRQFIFMRENY